MKVQRIDKAFINYLRLNLSTTNWQFDNTEPFEIVPKELTHNYLLNNFSIDRSILKYYCLPSSILLSENEFQEMVKHGFVGKRETALFPYSNIIYGAYYSRPNLEFGLSGIAYVTGKGYTIKGNPVKYFSDLVPYFKEYAKGFKDGFNKFENRKIKPHLTILAGQNDYVIKVFEYLTTNFLFSHGWLSGVSGFATNQDNELVNAFEAGQKQAYFYRAWSIVFSNNILFAPLFQKSLTALPQQQTSKLSEVFTVTDWKKYVDAFTQCNPKLLNEVNGVYQFIGNVKTQKGVIAAWFKFLKSKGIIDQSLNREVIAKTLSNEIQNYSIAASSVDNESNAYKHFEGQLLEITGLNN